MFSNNSLVISSKQKKDICRKINNMIHNKSVKEKDGKFIIKGIYQDATTISFIKGNIAYFKNVNIANKIVTRINSLGGCNSVKTEIYVKQEKSLLDKMLNV